MAVRYVHLRLSTAVRITRGILATCNVLNSLRFVELFFQILIHILFSEKVVKERCIELMSMEHSSIDESKISEVETETSLLIAESMWDVISPATSASSFCLGGNVERTTDGEDETKRTSNASTASNVPILVGIFVLLLSIVLGFMLYQSD